MRRPTFGKLAICQNVSLERSFIIFKPWSNFAKPQNPQNTIIETSLSVFKLHLAIELFNHDREQSHLGDLGSLHCWTPV